MKGNLEGIGRGKTCRPPDSARTPCSSSTSSTSSASKSRSRLSRPLGWKPSFPCQHEDFPGPDLGHLSHHGHAGRRQARALPPRALVAEANWIRLERDQNAIQLKNLQPNGDATVYLYYAPGQALLDERGVGAHRRRAAHCQRRSERAVLRQAGCRMALHPDLAAFLERIADDVGTGRRVRRGVLQGSLSALHSLYH